MKAFHGIAVKALLPAILLGAFTALASIEPDVRLRLHDSKMTVYADNVPLSAILRQLRYWNVEVDFMPEPDFRLSARMDAVDIETALAELLAPYSYLLRWRVVPGPFGRLTKIESIRLIGTPEPAVEPGVQTPRHSGLDPVLPVMPHPEAPGTLIVRDEILLRVKPGVGLDEFERLLNHIHGGVVDGCAITGVYRIRLRPYTNIPEIVERLMQQPIVDRAEPHWVWNLPGDRQPGKNAYQDAMRAVRRAPINQRTAASAGTAGRLAVLDTGIHPEAPWRDALHSVSDFLYAAGAGDDQEGHGTHMTGLAAGFLKPLGIQSDATNPVQTPEVMSMKIFDREGNAPMFAIMRAIEQAIKQNAGIVSLSWGGRQNSRFLEEMLVFARQRGVLTLAAAGNDAGAEPLYPAALPAVIAVGELNPDGKPWEASSRGEAITILAPGFAATGDDNQQPGLIAGTSVSTAYAAGLLARYSALHPERSAEDNLAGFIRLLTPAQDGQEDADAFPNAVKIDAQALQRLFQ